MIPSRFTAPPTNGIAALNRESVPGSYAESQARLFQLDVLGSESDRTDGIERDPLHAIVRVSQAAGVGREAGFDLAVRAQARLELGQSASVETIDRVVALLRDDRALRAIFEAAWIAGRLRPRPIDATTRRPLG